LSIKNGQKRKKRMGEGQGKARSKEEKTKITRRRRWGKDASPLPAKNRGGGWLKGPAVG